MIRLTKSLGTWTNFQTINEILIRKHCLQSKREKIATPKCVTELRIYIDYERRMHTGS